MKKSLFAMFVLCLVLGLWACAAAPKQPTSTVTLPPISTTASCPPKPVEPVPSTTVSKPGKLEMQLQGDLEITLEYGESYVEPGVVALYYHPSSPERGELVEVTITNTMDPAKLGTYQIIYLAVSGNLSILRERTVHIVDTVAPQIQLVTDPEHFTAFGQPYEEEGFTATDNYDGDITHLVESREENGVVIYTVTDSSGNRAEAVRPVVYDHRKAPLITLEGSAACTVQAGTCFIEPGYSAIDDADGDVTQQVTVTGEVDFYTAGTYILTYSVTDSHGNTASVQRTVTVEPIRQPDRVEPGGKVIYLTFDDGPSQHTERLLAILEKYNAKATFFVCKTGYISLLPKIAEGGHSIGVHSVTHRYSQIYASKEAYFKDLYQMQDIIYDYTGIRTTLIRFPGGSSNTVSANYCKGIMTELVKSVKDQGFQYFDWSVTSGDAGGTTSTEKVYQNVINGCSGKRRPVVLQHDIKGFSVDAVEKIIIWGLQNGYTFQALTPESPNCHHGINN